MPKPILSWKPVPETMNQFNEHQQHFTLLSLLLALLLSYNVLTRWNMVGLLLMWKNKIQWDRTRRYFKQRNLSVPKVCSCMGESKVSPKLSNELPALSFLIFNQFVLIFVGKKWFFMLFISQWCLLDFVIIHSRN